MSLLAIKPQLTYLVLLAILLLAWQRREWKAPVSAAAIVALLASVALAVNPSIFQQYVAMMSGLYARLPSGTGAVLRLGVGLFALRDLACLQWLPPIIGLGWFGFYWQKYKSRWSWPEQMPVVVVASLLTAAHGWISDESLLVVPVTLLFGEYARNLGYVPQRAVLVYTIMNLAAILGFVTMSHPPRFMYAVVAAMYLVAPAVLGYALAGRGRKPAPQHSPTPVDIR